MDIAGFHPPHGGWTYAARLDDDPRFRRDCLYQYDVDDKMVEEFGQVRSAGEFVRRELVTEESLQLLQEIRLFP
ncbi:MAG: hypothetical protein N2049_09995 [Anaerolineales bacterium]|nr:hypothetical protein [Anaerolineales bacterium]